MSLETIVNDLVAATDALHASITDKRTVLDSAAAAAATSLTTTQGLQAQATTSAATAAAKATEATNNAAQVAAYKTAAAALDVTTTATAAVTNLLPDMLAKKDPARHPFRKKMPTLVLDFERQKCHRYSPSTGFGETPLLPFMTFARNSAATYTGPDGLIKTAAANEARFDYDPATGECKGLLVEEQRTNLLAYGSSPQRISGEFIPYNAVSPDQTLNAGRLIGISPVNYYYSYTSALTATAYTFSLYVKQQSATTLLWGFEAAGFGANKVATFTFATATSTTPTGTTVTVENKGSGWYRLSMTATTIAAGTVTVHAESTGTYLWGLQLEAGAFPTSYIPTPATFTGRASTATYLDANGVLQTAANGVARSNAYDYDSDGVLRPIGLLLEASATNKLLYSEQFDNAAWNKSACSVTANATTAPDGTITAGKLAEDTSTGSHYIAQLKTASPTTTYTFSVYLKPAGRNNARITFNYGSVVNATYLDLVNGSVLSSTSGIGVSIKKSPNGFFKYSITGTTDISTVVGVYIFLADSTPAATYPGDGTSGIYIWGAQLEAGSYATSYIPTTSAQVTRAADTSTSAQATRVADDAKVDGTKFSDFYNQNAGTLIGKMVAGACSTYAGNDGIARGVCVLSDGTSNNRIRFMQDAGKRVRLAIGGSDVVDLSTSEATSNVSRIGGLVLKKDAYAFSVDGASPQKDTSGGVPVTSELSIGRSNVVGGYLDGCITRIVYYPTAFTNEELQAATSE